MNTVRARVVGMALLLTISGCTSGPPSHLPLGKAAYEAIPAQADAVRADEILRFGDRLAIRVMGEPELTSDVYRIDSNGMVQMPLAGDVLAVGRTTAELRDELTRRLATRFIRNPQVAVIVAERRKTTFAVEGAVREPGVFEAAPATTLLSALAQAKSPNNVARLSEVMIFRTVGSDHMGARFDISAIRRGDAPDPQVLAGDTIVVGTSNLKGAWHEFLQAAPAFNVFYLFRNF